MTLKNLSSLFNNFNSIKVRLELACCSLVNQRTLLFQFHKGAIRTR